MERRGILIIEPVESTKELLEEVALDVSNVVITVATVAEGAGFVNQSGALVADMDYVKLDDLVNVKKGPGAENLGIVALVDSSTDLVLRGKLSSLPAQLMDLPIRNIDELKNVLSKALGRPDINEYE